MTIQTIEDYAITLGRELKQRHWKITTAESCTAGGLAYWITSVSGSSHWFEEGFITYSNLVKEKTLGVNPKSLEQEGAVSESVACQMAEGALRIAQADMSIAITGIAGPSGGTSEKPVGTVWIAYSSQRHSTQAFDYHLMGDRSSIRQQAIEQALKIGIEYIHLDKI